MSAEDFAAVREALDTHPDPVLWTPAREALDRLEARIAAEYEDAIEESERGWHESIQRVKELERERDALQHTIDCANTPLMRDVLRERDEALHAEAEYENAMTWDTSCLNCSKLLDTNYAQYVRIEALTAALRIAPTHPTPQGRAIIDAALATSEQARTEEGA